MSDPAEHDLFMTEDEYLRSEAESPFKREYVGGYVYPLHGATRAQAGANSDHGTVSLNIAAALLPAARRAGCRVYSSDMQVHTRTPTGGAVYYYPDVVATCEPVAGGATSIQAPCFIAEVLSASTRHTDRTDKLWAYTALPSLQTYLIVDPQRRLVRAIERGADGDWTERELDSQAQLSIFCLNTVLTLDEMYDGIG